MEVGLRSALGTTIEEQPVVLPSSCPNCDGPGYLESINLVRETKTLSCRGCGHYWESQI
jgi:hypothetical protein